MDWSLTEDVEEFLGAAGDLIRRDRARNTVLLTVTESLREHPVESAILGWTDGAAFACTPPYPVLLTDMRDDEATSLARALVPGGHDLRGVNGHPGPATAFAAEWQRLTGGTTTPYRSMRLFRLGDLTPPQPMPSGAPRAASTADADLVLAWYEAFGREVNDMGRQSRAAVERNIARGGVTVWEADGSPVSMAGVSASVAGMVRVSAVYTPPQRRGRGFAGAVTYEVSRAARAAGAEEILLYTDLTNPVSNALYPRLGYRPIEDRVVIAFTGDRSY
jgi:predicted GNAT family acetyltransferase